MALRTRAAVPGFTFAESLMVRETVAVETFALLATSLIFMRVHERVHEKEPKQELILANRYEAKGFAGNDEFAGGNI